MLQNYVSVMFNRMILRDKPFLICPACYGKCLQSFPCKTLEFYSLKCGICDKEIGFVKGEVRARKLGSYIRLNNEKGNQISLDISSFGDDFDVRKDDEVTIIYQTNYFRRKPILLINHTINEMYYLRAYKPKTGETVNLEEYKHHLLNDKTIGRFYQATFAEDNLPEIRFIDIDKKVDIEWKASES